MGMGVVGAEVGDPSNPRSNETVSGFIVYTLLHVLVLHELGLNNHKQEIVTLVSFKHRGYII